MNRQLLILLLFLVCSTNGAAAQHPLESGDLGSATIQADTLSMDPEGSIIQARGQVTLDLGKLRIDTPQLTLHLRDRVLTMNRPVVWGYPNLEITGKRLVLECALPKGAHSRMEPEPHAPIPHRDIAWRQTESLSIRTGTWI